MTALLRSIVGSRVVDDERRRIWAELGHGPPPDDDEMLGPTSLPDGPPERE